MRNLILVLLLATLAACGGQVQVTGQPVQTDTPEPAEQVQNDPQPTYFGTDGPGGQPIYTSIPHDDVIGCLIQDQVDRSYDVIDNQEVIILTLKEGATCSD